MLISLMIQLVAGFGVYVMFVQLEQAEQFSKNSATDLINIMVHLNPPCVRFSPQARQKTTGFFRWKHNTTCLYSN